MENEESFHNHIDYNSLLKTLEMEDVVICIRGNKVKVIKNRYGYAEENEKKTPDGIIQLFVGMLASQCKIDFFVDSFEIDLKNAINEVIKNYSFKINVDNV